ncbi:hypothetical protein Tco_1418658 [Tanacetum coccineum]
MSKTRTDYGSGVARPKIDNKDQFELKGQLLKELRENTFSSSDNDDANENTKKVLEIVDLFHVPNITVDQLMLRVYPISLTGAASLGNPVNEILLKLNLPDHRILKDGGEGLRERMELDLEARLIGETLVLNRSLDPFFRDYIELNDLNVPLELRRDQVDDLMPTIEEGEVVEEFRARNDARMISKVFGYPNFAVLEDMDAYRDEGMGDVIFGKPFLREVGINAKRFKGMITIHNGNEEDLAERKEIDNVGGESTIWKF